MPDRSARGDVQVAVASLALAGYVYAIGWLLTCVRLAAVRLPVGTALPGVHAGAVLATGVRATLAMAIVFAAMCAFAYLVHLFHWGSHREEWREIVETNRTSARERHLRRRSLKRKPPRPALSHGPPNVRESVIRVVAGFNVLVLASALGLVGARLAKKAIDQWQPGHWWALPAPWAVFSIVLAVALARVNPLRGGRLVHGVLWLVVIGVAMVSSAPVGLLVLTWAAIGSAGRRYGTRPLPGSAFDFVRSPLPWALLTVYALVAIAYAAMPPAGFPQTFVQTTTGTRVGGYIGRTSAGVYLATCTPLANATSTRDRVELIPSRTVESVSSTDTDFTLDTGYRPSLPTLALRALGIDTETEAWIRPEVRERRGTCAGTPPPAPSEGHEVARLGDRVHAGRVPPDGRALDGERPLAASGSRIAALAKRFQPTVLVSITDPFWPVSLSAALEDVGGDGRRTCVLSVRRGDRRCPLGAHATPAQLQRQGGPDDYLRYPTEPALTTRPLQQLQAFLRGQRDRQTRVPSLRELLTDPGLLDPWRTAQVYFYYAGRAEPSGWPAPDAAIEKGLVALQYWFFYPYNYYPTLVDGRIMNDAPLAGDLANTDLHQGDWEHVTVLVDPRTGRARWLYTARHADEGQYFAWNSPLLTFDEGHPVVQAAYGGHPTYPSGCGGRVRYRKPLNGLVSDWLVCGTGRFAFRAAVTPLVDLAATGWACWRGRFGAPTPNAVETAARSSNRIVRVLARQLKANVLVAGPRSPLWQAENGHLQADDGENEHRPDSGPCVRPGGPAAVERQAAAGG